MTVSRKYKCGLYVGRFQPLHRGHEQVIKAMMDKCDTCIIAVGSAQEYGTERNPFSYGVRASLIYGTFSAAYHYIQVVPVPDREHPSNDASWGDYLLATVKSHTGLTPDVIFEGEEVERSNWYDNHDIPVVTVPRSITPISGTQVRQALLDDSQMSFMRMVPEPVWFSYPKLRKEILKCYN